MGETMISKIIDADSIQAQKEKDIRKQPLTYDDIKDDPYYYIAPSGPEVRQNDRH
jgi:hypothetical protein